MGADLIIVHRTSDPVIPQAEACSIVHPVIPQAEVCSIVHHTSDPVIQQAEVCSIVHHTSDPFVPVIPQAPSSEACSIQSQTHYSVAPVHMDPRMYKSGFVPTNLSAVGRLCSNRSVINSSFITVYNTGPAEPKASAEEDKTTWCCCLS